MNLNSATHSKLLDLPNDLGYLVVTVIISIGYTVLRFTLNTEYEGATWQQLYDLNAPIPFGYRILVPLLSTPLVNLGLSIKEAYSVWEFLFCCGLILIIRSVIQDYTTALWAKASSVLFIYTLTFSIFTEFQWPVYYPHDTAAMFFIALGIRLSLSGSLIMLVPITFIATLNRESAVLMVLIYMLMHVDQVSIKKYWLQSLWIVMAYLLGRLLVSAITADNPRPYFGPLAFIIGKEWRVNNNLDWFIDLKNMFLLLASFAFLPLLWMILKQWMPLSLRMTGLSAVLYFAQLLFVGNIYEPRIFGEIWSSFAYRC
jgi:hypothetical protein